MECSLGLTEFLLIGMETKNEEEGVSVLNWMFVRRKEMQYTLSSVERVMVANRPDEWLL